MSSNALIPVSQPQRSLTVPTGFQPMMRLVDFLGNVYVPLRMAGCSPVSIRYYYKVIACFERFLNRPPVLADINEDTLALYLRHYVESGRSHTAGNIRAKALISFWRFAKRKKYLPKDLDVDGLVLLKVPYRMPEAYTPEEFSRLLWHAVNASGNIGKIPSRLWWPAIILLLYDTGLRITSAMMVRVDELDLTSGWLRVPAERMKNYCEQVFKLKEETLAAVERLIVPGRELLFPFPYRDDRRLHDRFKTLLREAGLPYGRRHMFHKIRRTTATYLAMTGGESLARMQLGHRDPTSIKRYIDPRFLASHDATRHLPTFKLTRVINLAYLRSVLNAAAVEVKMDDMRRVVHDIGCSQVILAGAMGLTQSRVCQMLRAHRLQPATMERLQVALRAVAAATVPGWLDGGKEGGA